MYTTCQAAYFFLFLFIEHTLLPSKYSTIINGWNDRIWNNSICITCSHLIDWVSLYVHLTSHILRTYTYTYAYIWSQFQITDSNDDHPKMFSYSLLFEVEQLKRIHRKIIHKSWITNVFFFKPNYTNGRYMNSNIR